MAEAAEMEMTLAAEASLAVEMTVAKAPLAVEMTATKEPLAVEMTAARRSLAEAAEATAKAVGTATAGVRMGCTQVHCHTRKAGSSTAATVIFKMDIPSPGSSCNDSPWPF